MRNETILWTACPNGMTGRAGVGRLSVHVAPRLQSDDESDNPRTRLDRFPGVQHWARRVANLSFEVEIEQDGVTATYPAAMVSDQPDDELWDALFDDETFIVPWVKPVENPRVLTFSDPVLQLRTGVLGAHFELFKTASYGQGLGDLNSAATAYSGLGYGDASRAAGRARVAGLRNRMRRGGTTTTRQNLTFGLVTDGDAVKDASIALERSLIGKFAPEEADLDRGDSAARATPEPDPPDPVPPRIDFHAAMGMLGSHPILLRKLGLVFDLTVDLTASPRGTTPDFGRPFVVRAVPLIDARPPESGRRELHILGATRTDGDFTTIPSLESLQLKGGFVDLNDPHFVISSLDVPRSAMKAMAFARASQNRVTALVGRTPPPPLVPGAEPIPSQAETIASATEELPTLTTGGITVSRVDANEAQAQRHSRQVSLAENFFARQSSAAAFEIQRPTEFLYADDITRGHRIDVKDVAIGRWFSLHHRFGRYLVGRHREKAIEVTKADRDEGFVIASEVTHPNDVKVVSSTLGEWDGWSLSVARPLRVIDKLDQVVEAPTLENDDVPLVVRLDRAYGLPMLRFGRKYELRARTVDLCGNSLTPPPDDAAVPAGARGQARDDGNGAYRRYEPVLPPQAVPATEPLPSEAAELVVVRSERFDQPGAKKSSRHLFPPRTTELEAERHGVFDVATGAGASLPAATSWKTITGVAITDHSPAPVQAFPYESGKLTELPTARTARGGVVWLQPNGSAIRAPWLPDPLAAGAVLRASGGAVAVGAALDHAWHGVGTVWPNHAARLLDAAAVGGTSGRAVNAGGRWLVEVPPGATVTLQLSSKPGANAPAVLAQLAYIDARIANDDTPQPKSYWQAQRAAVLAGTHAGVTPFQVLRVVHAVRTPKGPTWASVPATGVGRVRDAGDTFVQFNVTASFRPMETSKVEVIGRWTQWVDAGPNPDVPPARLVFDETAFGVLLSPVNDNNPAFTGPLFIGITGGSNPAIVHAHRHEFGDTRHRKLTYSLRATSAHAHHFTDRKTVSTGTNRVVVLDGRGVLASSVQVRVPNERTGALDQLPADAFVVDATAGSVKITGELPVEPSDVEFTYIAQPVTAEGPAKSFSALATATPPAPEVADVLPLFSWARKVSNGSDNKTATITSTMTGGWIRVYLKRPWFMSGEDERLAITAFGAFPPTFADRVQPSYDTLTRFARDPLFASDKVIVRPSGATPTGGLSVTQVLNAASKQTGYNLYNDVNAVGQFATFKLDATNYDEVRDQWFVDIQLDVATSYWPFLRPSFFRFQPNMTPGVEQKSPLVVADWVQVPPTRTTVLSRVPSSSVVKVSVKGHSIAKSEAAAAPHPNLDETPGPTTMQITLESRTAGSPDPVVGWTKTLGPITLTPAAYKVGQPQMWSGQLTLPAAPAGLLRRIVVEEVQILNSDADQQQFLPGESPPPGEPKAKGARIVFQDLLEVPTKLFSIPT